MLMLRTLGALDLRDAGNRRISAVLAHPKRSALLVYLAVARPRGLQRRDALLEMFWPDASEKLAMASLRKAIAGMRRVLGDAAIVADGEQAFGVDAALFTCDAFELEEAAARGDEARVRELHAADFLDGFELADAPAFDRWLAAERARLRELAFPPTPAPAPVIERAEAIQRPAAFALPVAGRPSDAVRYRVGDGPITGRIPRPVWRVAQIAAAASLVLVTAWQGWRFYGAANLADPATLAAAGAAANDAFQNGRFDEAERRYRTITEARPEDAGAWLRLGDVLYLYNPVRGRSIEEARPAFQRALANGAGDEAQGRLFELQALAGNYDAAASLRAGIPSTSRLALLARTVHVFTRGGDAARRQVLADARRASDSAATEYALRATFLLQNRRDAIRVARVLTETNRPAALRAFGHILVAHLEAAGGRLKAADEELRLAEALDRTAALEHRGIIETLPFLPTTHTQRLMTREALSDGSTGDTLAKGRETPLGADGVHAVHRQYLLALLSAELGELDRAKSIAMQMDRQVRRDGPMAAALAHGVRARVLALQDKQDDALRELSRIREPALAPSAVGTRPFDEFAGERFLRAEVLRELGGRRLDDALRWYASLDRPAAFERVFVAPAHRRMGEILLEQGRGAEAVAHFERFAYLWRDCDPELRPLVDAVRTQLVELRASPVPATPSR